MTVKKNILIMIKNKTVSPKAKPPLLPSAFAPSAFLKCFVRGKLLTLRTVATRLRRARPSLSRFIFFNRTSNIENCQLKRCRNATGLPLFHLSRHSLGDGGSIRIYSIRYDFQKNQINRKKVWTVWTVWTVWPPECNCPLSTANYRDTRPLSVIRTDRQYSKHGHTWTSKVWPEYGQYGRKYGRQECNWLLEKYEVAK